MSEYLLKAEKLEKEYGTVELLKVALSSLNILLVKKGICTKKEIQNSFLKELKEQGYDY